MDYPLLGSGPEYHLVYSLPDSDDPAYQAISNYFSSGQATQSFKTARHARSFDRYNSGDRYMVIGTVASNRIVERELAALGMRLEGSGARLGRRSYDLRPCYVVARYGRDGAEILLQATSDFSCIVNTDIDLEPWTYRLMNGAGELVEGGRIRSLLGRFALVPDETHPEAARPSASAWADTQAAVKAAIDAAAATYLSFPEDGDYGFADAYADGAMLFIGEGPHHDALIAETVEGLARHLGETRGYGVFAMESLFSQSPFVMAASDGVSLPSVLPTATARVGEGFGTVLDSLVEGNASLPSEKRIFCTTLDIDHAINHTKAATMAYWGYVATKCQSAAARAELAAYIPTLQKDGTLEGIQAWLDGLERIFSEYSGSMSAGDRAELAFAVALERASAKYQLSSAAAEGFAAERARFEEIRGFYFRSTIERAWAEAARRGAKLICYVGGAHAVLTDFDHKDYPVGRISEARYFNEDFSDTKGAVRSILVARPGLLIGDPLVASAIARAAGRRRAYIDLRVVERGAGSAVSSSELFTSDGRAKHDALIVIIH